MNSGYKPTTNGRALLAKLMALSEPLTMTRVGIGSGKIAEGTDLADVHELVQYVADGEIAERRHENDRLYLTIQFSNALHQDLPMFYIGEFMIFAQDPETGEEVDLAYATLGDYQQPVPAYREEQGASVYNFPLVMIVSDEIEVTIDVSPGLVTHDELEDAAEKAVREALDELQPGWSCCGSLQLTIPKEGWVSASEPSADHNYTCDVSVPDVTSAMIPQGTPLPGYFSIAQNAEMMGGCTVLNGAVRFFSKSVPDGDIVCKIDLFRMGGGGGGGSVDAGVGLGFGMDGKLNVLLGNGLTVDNENKINVDKEEVVTESDMLNEDETEQSLREILLHENEEET